MNLISSAIRIFSFLFILLYLNACSSLSFGTANQLKNLDPINDDVARMIFALELPNNIRPIEDESAFLISATTSGYGSREIVAPLKVTKNFTAISDLPPLASERIYYLFIISEKGQRDIEEFQQWAKDLKKQYENVGGKLSINIKIKFCRSKEIDIDNQRFSVFISLPNKTKLNPLISNMKISDMIKGGADNIQKC